jgi:hypothetical protein
MPLVEKCIKAGSQKGWDSESEIKWSGSSPVNR